MKKSNKRRKSEVEDEENSEAEEMEIEEELNSKHLRNKVNSGSKMNEDMKVFFRSKPKKPKLKNSNFFDTSKQDAETKVWTKIVSTNFNKLRERNEDTNKKDHPNIKKLKSSQNKQIIDASGLHLDSKFDYFSIGKIEKDNRIKKKKHSNKSPPSSMSKENFPEFNGKYISSWNLNQLKSVPPILEYDLLTSFSFPLNSNIFLKDYFRKKVFVSHADANRVQYLISEHLHSLELEEMLESTASESIFVWMKQTSNDKIESFELSGSSAVSSAIICHNSGASLYFRSSQEMADTFVGSMSNCIGLNFGGYYSNGDLKGEIEVFVTRKGHITDWHFDFMENFTIQLKGSKRWRFKPSGIPHPLRGFTPHYKQAENMEQQQKVHQLHDPTFTFNKTNFEDAEEVTLVPGSVMYFPAGFYHQVECLEDSISINISLVGSSWADLVSNGIHQLLWSKENWRELISFQSVHEARKKLQSHLNSLQEIVSQLTVDDLLPNSIFYPRETTIHVKNYSFKNNPSPNISENSKFKKNLLAQLIYLDPEHFLIEVEVEEEESDEEVEDNSTPEEESVNGTTSDEEDEQSEEEEANLNLDKLENSGEIEDETPIDYYSLHISFGGEELESAVNMKLLIDSSLKPAVDWLKAKTQFTFQNLKEQPFFKGVDVGKLKKLLSVLVHLGYLHQIN